MRTLLVNPPVPEFYYNKEFYLPSGLLYLSSALKKQGSDVNILDFRIYQKDEDKKFEFYEDILSKKIKELNPEIIGLGCLFSGNFPDVSKLSEVSKKYSKVPVIIGGIHPTIYPRDILRHYDSIDAIILGEGEIAITQIADSFDRKDYDLTKIESCASKNGKDIVINEKKNYIINLDTLPFPAYELINLEDYYVDTSNWHNPKNLSFQTSIPIITSRSCPNRCNFCSMYRVMGSKWRARSAKNVIDEIELMYTKYNQNHFSIMDDNFTFNKKRVLEICDEIKKRDLNIQYETPNGLSIKTLDKEVLDAMNETGLVRTFLAIESGSEYIRNKIMGKGLSQKKIYEVMDLLKEYKNLYTSVYFIMGMPEETVETLEETYKMMKDIKFDRIYLHNIIPFPGTDVYDQAIKDNLLVDMNPEELYKSSELYITNYKRIFIKPYALELDQLRDFRTKCENLIKEKKKLQ